MRRSIDSSWLARRIAMRTFHRRSNASLNPGPAEKDKRLQKPGGRPLPPRRISRKVRPKEPARCCRSKRAKRKRDEPSRVPATVRSASSAVRRRKYQTSTTRGSRRRVHWCGVWSSVLAEMASRCERPALRYAPHATREPADRRRTADASVACPPTPAARFVVLVDGSRSMSQHAQTALKLASALGRATTRVEVFTFSTALQRVTIDLQRASLGKTIVFIRWPMPGAAGRRSARAWPSFCGDSAIVC